MVQQKWSGTSVIYVCPLKALLNNLLPRLETYTAWLGRTAALWHGDVTSGARKRILAARPDVLLTTPESLEAMLVSANVDHTSFFSGLRTVVVDEAHAFAGEDRGLASARGPGAAPVRRRASRPARRAVRHGREP